MSKARLSRPLAFIVAAVALCALSYAFLRQPLVGAGSTGSSAAENVSSAGRPRYAFATFYSSHPNNDTEEDAYFTATRVMAYQLLHQPHTRSRRDFAFLVVVPPHVSETKRKVLRQEGATVIPVEALTPSSWIAHPSEKRWIDQFTKLRMFGMTQYERILYMDSDTLLTRPLDDIWDEATVAMPRKTDYQNHNAKLEGMVGPKSPAEYLIAGSPDNEGPRERTRRPFGRLNAGFLLFKPDIELFNYYLSILNRPEPIFDASFMEMGLLNYAHRIDGPMPWTQLPFGRYSNNWPSLADLRSGSATLHDKFWESSNKDWIDRELIEMWWRTQGRMEGYWQQRNEVHSVKQ